MSYIIYKGSTPTIRLAPTNGMHVDELGTPTVAIVQELVYLAPEVTIDSANNRIEMKLTEDETLQLVPNVETKIQQMWLMDNGDIVRFPEHDLIVKSTLIQNLTLTVGLDSE